MITAPHLMPDKENDVKELTLFRLPGPVLIMVYKLSPELFESVKTCNDTYNWYWIMHEKHVMI